MNIGPTRTFEAASSIPEIIWDRTQLATAIKRLDKEIAAFEQELSSTPFWEEIRQASCKNIIYLQLFLIAIDPQIKDKQKEIAAIVDHAVIGGQLITADIPPLVKAQIMLHAPARLIEKALGACSYTKTAISLDFLVRVALTGSSKEQKDTFFTHFFTLSPGVNESFFAQLYMHYSEETIRTCEHNCPVLKKELQSFKLNYVPLYTKMVLQMEQNGWLQEPFPDNEIVCKYIIDKLSTHYKNNDFKRALLATVLFHQGRLAPVSWMELYVLLSTEEQTTLLTKLLQSPLGHRQLKECLCMCQSTKISAEIAKLFVGSLRSNLEKISPSLPRTIAQQLPSALDALRAELDPDAFQQKALNALSATLEMPVGELMALVVEIPSNKYFFISTQKPASVLAMLVHSEAFLIFFYNAAADQRIALIKGIIKQEALAALLQAILTSSALVDNLKKELFQLIKEALASIDSKLELLPLIPVSLHAQVTRLLDEESMEQGDN